MDVLKLASSIEGAATGSDYLDYAIQRLFGLKKPIPAYTSSLDAAMLLVPEPWSIHRLAHGHNGQGRLAGWAVELYRPDEVMIDASASARAVTAPLAICAAALRALAISGAAAPALAREAG
ncbi:MAG TPA: hypothetical protein VFA50_02385 [Stellaceae bacterium]|nr:hypothetical protein [Stellaceae bacterium]